MTYLPYATTTIVILALQIACLRDFGLEIKIDLIGIQNQYGEGTDDG